MSSGQFFLFRKYKLNVKLVNSVNKIINAIKNYETPERLRGTFLERWGKYWKNLYLDYKEVTIDVAKDCQAHPVKASMYATLSAFCIYLNKHNPDECSFKDQLLQSTMKIIQVGEPIRNPESQQHVKWLDKCYNEGIIRQLNIGIISLIWLDNYDKMCSLYEATCPYLKPQYVTFYQRVVDVGFLEKWWFLENKMKDYDVNDVGFNTVQQE